MSGEAFSQSLGDHRLDAFPGVSVRGLGSLEMLMLGHGASIPGRFSLGKCSFGSSVLQQFITTGGIDRGSSFCFTAAGLGGIQGFPVL